MPDLDKAADLRKEDGFSKVLFSAFRLTDNRRVTPKLAKENNESARSFFMLLIFGV